MTEIPAFGLNSFGGFDITLTADKFDSDFSFVRLSFHRFLARCTSAYFFKLMPLFPKCGHLTKCIKLIS